MTSKRVGIESSLAVSEAVRLANVDVIAAYPITPQTHIVESLAEMVANGKLDAEYIPVESEHSAMSACLGSCAVGARTFTATASQGLILMHEVLLVAASLRLPIVMAVANRALSGPLNIWGDHSDAMITRDAGWIQIFIENGQQAFDQVLCAFRIAEHPDVLLPTVINIDGFHVSHVIEPIYILDQKSVDEFLPSYKHPRPLDPDDPITMGCFAAPNLYTEARKALDESVRSSKKVILDTWKKYGDLTGRYYNPVEKYKADGAETILVTMGSYSENAMIAIDDMQDDGKKIGLVRLRLWRPFPYEEIQEALSSAKNVVVLDRAISLGGPAPVCSEIRAALYTLDKKPQVVSVVGGLGGRDISPDNFKTLIDLAMQKLKAGETQEIIMFGVRE
ncbi:MAG: transketolase C-terminal domain-containing protein [Dehalococcoidia bacterium]|jgi:pyruvate ferredoxin oxidoreductase alpha subunit